MTKDVIVSIRGLQFDQDGESPLEVITRGCYYNKNGKHYILYDETLGDSGIETNNTIKIDGQRIDVIKKGESNVHMVFEPDKKNMTFYNTPFGDMLIGINTLNIECEETEQDINARVNYSLEVNDTHISDCAISMNIKSKDSKSFRLN